MEKANNVNELNNIEEIDLEKTYKASLLPAGKYSDILNVVDYINEADDDTIKKLSEKELFVASTNINTLNLTNRKDVYSKRLQDEDSEWINDVEHDGKKYNIDNIKINAKGRLSGPAATNKFASSLGIGSPGSVTLWHSGFNVTVRPPLDSDILSLELAIHDNEIELGRLTNGLIYSNYSVVLVRLVTDFIVNHIISTSLTIPEGKDIRDFIKLQDLPLLVLAIIKSKYSLGYEIIKACKNTLVYENDKPLCEYMVTGKVDPKWLLRVDRKALTPEMLKIVSNKRPNSVTVEDIAKYQEELDRIKDKTIVLNVNDVEVNIKLSTPTISKYIDEGELWVNIVAEKAVEIFTDKDTDSSKNDKINKMSQTAILGIYNTYVKEMNVDEDIYTDKETILENLIILSSNDEAISVFLNKVIDYIEESTIAIVATQAFECPICKEKELDAKQEGSKNEAFKEFIPLNILEHFFDLGALKLQDISTRDI